ncbi:MAG: pectinesterase family protein [Bacteroidia bacterium]
MRLLITCLFLWHLAAFAQYKTEIYVAKDGSGDFTSIQEAIDNTKSFPDKPITIFIKAGVYQEKVKVHAWNNNLTLKGENRRIPLFAGMIISKKLTGPATALFIPIHFWCRGIISERKI